MLDVGTDSGNTLSPMVACQPGDQLTIEWSARFKLQGGERLTLLLHGYGERGVEHAAIPAIPTKLGTRSLYGTNTDQPDWQSGSVKIDLNLLHPDAKWLRLEWRVVLSREMRHKQRAGRVFFDDMVITRMGSA